MMETSYAILWAKVSSKRPLILALKSSSVRASLARVSSSCTDCLTSLGL